MSFNVTPPSVVAPEARKTTMLLWRKPQSMCFLDLVNTLFWRSTQPCVSLWFFFHINIQQALRGAEVSSAARVESGGRSATGRGAGDENVRGSTRGAVILNPMVRWTGVG